MQLHTWLRLWWQWIRTILHPWGLWTRECMILRNNATVVIYKHSPIHWFYNWKLNREGVAVWRTWGKASFLSPQCAKWMLLSYSPLCFWSCVYITESRTIWYQKAQSPFVMSVCPSVTPAVSNKKLRSVPRTSYVFTVTFPYEMTEHVWGDDITCFRQQLGIAWGTSLVQ